MSTSVVDDRTICVVRGVLVTMAIGCGSAPVRPATLTATTAATATATTNATPGDAAAPDASTEECDSPVPVEIPQGSAELVICHVGDHADSPRQEEQGFIQHDMRADLVLPGKTPISTTLSAWTNGWEWGTSWTLAGALTNRGAGAVLLLSASYGPSPGIGAYAASLHVYAIAKGAWTEMFTTSANTIGVELDPANPHVATVHTCAASTASTPPGCEQYGDAEPGPTTRLTWTGSVIDTASVAVPGP